MAQVALELQEGMRFHAVGEDGVMMTLDSSADFGGSHAGLHPMELLLAGLGGCTAMDVLSILRKKRQEVTGYRVNVFAEQATTYPHVYTAIHIHHIIIGRQISPEAVRRSIELSETKYCPAYAMLSKAAPITSDFIIEQPA